MSQSVYLLIQIACGEGTCEQNSRTDEFDLHKLIPRSNLSILNLDSANDALMSPPVRREALLSADVLASGRAIKSLEEMERDYIAEILAYSDGNRSKAAKLLDINRRTLQRKIAQYF